MKSFLESFFEVALIQIKKSNENKLTNLKSLEYLETHLDQIDLKRKNIKLKEILNNLMNEMNQLQKEFEDLKNKFVLSEEKCTNLSDEKEILETENEELKKRLLEMDSIQEKLDQANKKMISDKGLQDTILNMNTVFQSKIVRIT